MSARIRPVFFSVRHMLMLAFLFLILVPYLITSVYFTLSMSSQIQYESASTLAADSNTMLYSLDTLLSETQRVAYLHLVDQDIARILQTPHQQYDLAYYTDERTMQSAIKHATSLNTSMLAVTFYSSLGTTYQVNHITNVHLVEEQSWFDLAAHSADGYYVTPVQKDGMSLSVLPVVYALNNSLDNACIGYVRIDYDLNRHLSGALRQLSAGVSVALFQDDTLLLDTGGRIQDLQSLGSALEQARPIRDDVVQLDLGGCTCALRSGYHENTRMRIVAYQPLQLRSHPAMQRIGACLVILAVMLCIDLLFSWMIARQIGSSINELSYAMDNAQHGQNELLPVTQSALVKSELDQLRSSYNSMINRITASAQREYEARVEQKNIAMRVLESQINPHFLYNSLNLIASLAQLAHQETLRSVAISLAAMLRYSIKGGSIVRLEEELMQTKHYINIIKLRFPDRIVIRQKVDPDLLPCYVPKLLLQPLLENACKYGTESAALMVVIEVTVRAQADNLLVMVADNGPGIPEDKLAELRERIAQYSPGDSSANEQARSIGLMNVHARVRARYGEPYGVTIESSGQGCTISILLPRTTELLSAQLKI